MDYSKKRKWKFLAATTIVAAIVCCFEQVNSHQLSLLNTPPILYVPDRNWRISETEKVGQIIARIRADDAENDELVFGLEPHYHANYAYPNANDPIELVRGKLPFRIDPVAGVVYLNESLAGRGGENFFLYITVSDGQLTAKNEVFVNILRGTNKWQAGYREPESMSTVIRNISRFLPAFDRLPGVQSVRNQDPNGRPSNTIPPGFGINPLIFKPKIPSASDGVDYQSRPTNYHNPDSSIWPTNFAEVDKHTGNVKLEGTTGLPKEMATTLSVETFSASRTKLKPITGNAVLRNNASISHNESNSDVNPRNVTTEDGAFSPTIRSGFIPAIIVLCGTFVACAALFAILFRNRLCTVSKTLKKKSKEEMVTKSNQNNMSSNLAEDNHNSMVMQHWNGPTAYSNRYVPWDRDQQMQQSMQLTNAAPALNSGPSEIVGMATTGPTLSPGAFASVSHTDQGKYDPWEFPRHRLKFFNIIGEGAFGQVWRCEAMDINGIEGVTTVAVKTLKENAAEAEKRDLGSELEVMKSLEPHVNVVRLLGCCTDKDPNFVIIEYVNRGKLQTYLRSSRAERHYGNTHGKSNILTSGDLTSFMYQVAKGMDYLTSRGIIHRDLAARNILITDDHTCKVADFGFARDVVTSKIYERKSEGKLPIRWMAIESLYDNIFSVKSDIWSFGILMWEIVTLGSTPYPGISAADVMRKVRDGYRLEKPEHCRRELYNVMYYCWSKDDNDRPTFTEVVQMLDKLLHTEMDYIELERFPDHNYYNILNLSGEKL